MQSGGSSGGASACSENNEGFDSHNHRKKYNRHTPEQIQRLEAFYRECPNPDESQRRQLGRELSLEPRQIKFWFQNKRTQLKTQADRADNCALRAENEHLRNENVAMKEALINLICPSCAGSSMGEEERKQDRKRLLQENILLKREVEKLSTMLPKYIGKPLSGSFNLPDTTAVCQASGSLGLEVNSLRRILNPASLASAGEMKPDPKLEKIVMTEIASNSMDKLIKLLQVDHPLWIKSSTDEQYILDLNSYEKIVSGDKELKYIKSRMESSKDSGLVAMEAKVLVDIYLDSDKWADLFPTVFPNVKTISLVEAGLLENRSGSLQLIYQQMHILSPLMQPREFYLLRYCQHIGSGTWAIVDVSYDCFGGNPPTSSTCWKHPSGCMIEEMPNGISRVTCVELVEVSDSFMVHPIYRKLVDSTLGFGANRWITNLQRTWSRFSCLKAAGVTDDELQKGQRSMVILANKMIKSYCLIFSSFGEDLHHLSGISNNRVRITVHKNTCPDLPVGIVIQAASSFQVPAAPERVFSFLNDHKMRSQWDVLSNGCPMSEVMQISTGENSSNVISILKPKNPSGEDFMIFQETIMMEQMGSLLVYAPVGTSNMLELVNGVGSPKIPILASGFAITPDGPDLKAAASTSRANPPSCGSIVTAAFQLLACSLSMDDMNEKLVPTADSLVSRVARVITSACVL